MIINFGDRVAVKQKNGGTKSVKIQGFWRFAPFNSYDEQETVSPLMMLHRHATKTNLRNKIERIEPCTAIEAHLVASDDGFFDIQTVEKIIEEANCEAKRQLQSDHENKIASIQLQGQCSLYGIFKLPVKKYPRFFDESGNFIQVT